MLWNGCLAFLENGSSSPWGASVAVLVALPFRDYSLHLQFTSIEARRNSEFKDTLPSGFVGKNSTFVGLQQIRPISQQKWVVLTSCLQDVSTLLCIYPMFRLWLFWHCFVSRVTRININIVCFCKTMVTLNLYVSVYSICSISTIQVM